MNNLKKSKGNNLEINIKGLRPSYNGDGLVNLISSIENHFSRITSSKKKVKSENTPNEPTVSREGSSGGKPASVPIIPYKYASLNYFNNVVNDSNNIKEASKGASKSDDGRKNDDANEGTGNANELEKLKDMNQAKDMAGIDEGIFNLGDNIENIVLIMIDGLGYYHLTENFKDLELTKNIRVKMTSVFPTTTAAAMTAVYTGMAPINHGIPAWFTYFKEAAVVSSMPSLEMRGFHYRFAHKYFPLSRMLKLNPLFSRINGVRKYSLIPKELLFSAYNQYLINGASKIGFNDINDMFKYILNLLHNIPGKKFIIAYWPRFDSLSHMHGVNNEITNGHLLEVDKAYQKFLEEFNTLSAKSKTRVFITADHGMIDIPESNQIWMENHRKLDKCLILPLCGEARVPFFYLKPNKEEEFKAYINEHLAEYGTLYSSYDLLKSNIFGLGKPHPSFEDRIGNYIMIMKDNYTLRDVILGEKRPRLIGHHGGLSKEELYIPLIIH
ncbi:MAG: alkaline phosphatase family protein [Promethearchaeota archaeon]